MSLSLCMIVKDEEEQLETCLKYARPYVDEIVVVDTGSTDGTMDIVRRYADVIREIEWPDSFAEARNVSMDAATGDVILILDADEYIDDEKTWEQIVHWGQHQDFGYGFIWVHNKVSAGAVDSERVRQPRLFKNTPEIRYHQRIHNQIEDRAIAYCKKHPHLLVALDIGHLWHNGYDLDQDAARDKYEQRIPLLKQTVAEARCLRDDSYYKYQLALMLHILRRFDEAAQTWQSMSFDGLSDFNRFYAHYIASHTFMRTGSMDYAYYHAEQMLRVNGDEPVGYLVAGNILGAIGRAQESIMLVIEAFLKNAERQRHVRFVLREEEVMGHLASIYADEDAERAEKLAKLRGNDAYNVLRALQRKLVPVEPINEMKMAA